MVVRFCTLASNASLNYFPDNTLTNFTNILPSQLQSPSGGTLYIRLRLLAISPVLQEANPEAEVIEVHIGELRAAATNAGSSQCLTRLAFPSGTLLGNTYVLREFGDVDFIPIRNSTLHKLSVLITDRTGEQLQLARGLPTFLHVEISDMGDPGHFNFTCISHLPIELTRNPDNKLSEFKVNLPQTLTLPGYEVALASIVFPHDMRLTTIDVHTTIYSSLFDESRHRTFTVNVGACETLDDLGDAIRDGLMSYERFPLLVEYISEGEYRYLVFRGIREAQVVTLEFSPEFMRVVDVGNLGYVKIHGKEMWQSGDLKLEPSMYPNQAAMVYCSCVEESMLGESQFKLLHIVPIEESRHVYEPEHLIYHPVTDRPFNTLEFQMTRVDGTPHALRSASNGSVIITLSFRPARRVAGVGNATRLPYHSKVEH